MQAHRAPTFSLQTSLSDILDGAHGRSVFAIDFIHGGSISAITTSLNTSRLLVSIRGIRDPLQQCDCQRPPFQAEIGLLATFDACVLCGTTSHTSLLATALSGGLNLKSARPCGVFHTNFDQKPSPRPRSLNEWASFDSRVIVLPSVRSPAAAASTFRF